jgi:hypothetical protein
MKAILPTTNIENGKNFSGDKEQIQFYQAVTPDFKTPLTVRVWMSRHSDGASPVYASIWIHSDPHHTAGHGKASGYGYYKTSAAVGAAIDSAGIKLDQDIDGRGDSVIEEALSAICAALGYDNVLIVRG